MTTFRLDVALQSNLTSSGDFQRQSNPTEKRILESYADRKDADYVFSAGIVIVKDGAFVM